MKYTTSTTGGGPSSRETPRRKAPSRRGVVLIAAFLVAVVALGALVSLGARGIAQATDAATRVVDGNTTAQWQGNLPSDEADSTQSVGRVWTDKSVFSDDYSFAEGDLSGQLVQKGSSDFLVGLSALSSCSNVTTTMASTSPLDVVLVLDVSGSMNSRLPVYASQLLQGGTYYTAETDGYKVKYRPSMNGWGYYTGYGRFRKWNRVTPKTSASDTQGRQLYRESRRIDALKVSANSFIDIIASKNTDSVKSRIAIVTYSDGATIRSGFSDNYKALHAIVDGLEAKGATAAASGLSSAAKVMAAARPDANRSLLFFTDGQPTKASAFDNGEAGAAINNAKGLKDGGTTIYGVGVFDKADSSVTNDQFNRYMNAVSSNYPNAECVSGEGTRTGSFTDLRLGERASADKNHYSAIADPNGITAAIKGIAGAIAKSATSTTTSTAVSGSPIRGGVSEAAGDTPGTLTFVDALGSYTEVSGDEMTLVYQSRLFKLQRRGDGAWRFVGDTQIAPGTNPAHPEAADVSDVTVEVTKGATLDAGDVVTVTIPANLLPVRAYSVSNNEGDKTMTVSSAYPIRLFYGVSLKEAAKRALDDPQDASHAEVLASQTSADGRTVDFYSNSFSKDANAERGSTTATFEPAETNRFYYYTSDTPLYVDEACTKRATDQNRGSWGSDLYYKDSCWRQGKNSEAIEVANAHGVVSVGGSEWNDGARSGAEGYYIQASTRTTDHAVAQIAEKADNPTGTAGRVLSPAWDEGGKRVVQHLGNNGKLSYPAPGSLRISKTVDWGNASDKTKAEKNVFEFTVSLADAAGSPLAGTYGYALSGEGAAETEGTVANGGTIALAHGQTATIAGLPSGARYTVTETPAAGFTVSDSSADSSASDGVVSGDITSGETSEATFANAYHAASVTLGADQAVSVRKELRGRGWRDTDKFRFTVSSIDASFQSSIDVTSQDPDHTKKLPSLSFDAPGTYEYHITEDASYRPAAGMSYSGAAFKVAIRVADDGAGKLYIPDNGVMVEQTRSDVDGGAMSGVNGTTVTFANTYGAASASVVIDGAKLYTDTTGGNPISLDKFSFQLEAVGGYRTDSPSSAVAAADVPMPASASGSTTTRTGLRSIEGTSGTFQFDAIPFTGDNVGYTYVYRVTEPTGIEPGMRYNTENKSYELTVAVSETDQSVVAETSLGSGDIVFSNVYDPADAILAADAGTAIHGTKALQGRQWRDDERFGFTLTPDAQSGAEWSAVSYRADDGAKEVAATDAALTAEARANGSESVDFWFGGTLAFSKVGTYTFSMAETSHDGSALPSGEGVNGMTYDRHTGVVTVEVTDNGQGQLVATATVEKGVFTNSYKTDDIAYDASAGLQIVKNMTGRAIGAGEFAFTMTGADQASTDRLNGGKPLTFSTDGAELSADGSTSMDTLDAATGLVFTQADAGKTYAYTLGEKNGGTTAGGVTYDGTTYTARLAVTDNGDGTLSVKTTVESSDPADQPQESAFTAGGDAAAKLKLTFDNRYDAGSVTVGSNGAATITGTKTLSNGDISGYDFAFSVKDVNGNEVATGSNSGTGTIAFTDITYTTESLNVAVASGAATVDRSGAADVYTFNYTVTEAEPGSGVTANTPAQGVTVKVSDSRAGQLSAEVSYDGGSMSFSNTYGADARFPLTISGKKIVRGARPGLRVPTLRRDTYAFTISAPEGTPMPASVTATNGSDGMVYFPVTYTMENVFGTGDATSTDAAGRIRDFTYTITEAGSIAGVTNEGGSKTVVVRVTDQGEGRLTAAVVSEQTAQGTDFTFTNTYDVAGAASSLTGDGGFTIAKSLTSNVGRALAAGEFTFQLRSVATGSVVAEAANAADGSVSMPAVGFSAPGTYSYKLAEAAGGASGMTYDRADYDVTATVADNGDGTLSVAWSMPGLEGKNVTFNNAYEAAHTSVSVVAGKVITGRPLFAGEFTFRVLEGEKVVAEAANDERGQIVFAPLSYERPGNHDYRIVEVKGDAVGVTYDDAVYAMRVSVTDDPAAGALSAKVSYPDGAPVFENSYASPDTVFVAFGATKRLEGRGLAAGEFGFELLGPDGEVVATATNAADGSVVFPDPVGFSAAGTYVYQVREALPEDDDPSAGGIQKDGVTYDEKAWTATVTVTDDYAGKLAAAVSYGDSAGLPSFVNTYVAPPRVPSTGDSTSAVLPTALVASGAALVVGAIAVTNGRRGKQ